MTDTFTPDSRLGSRVELTLVGTGHVFDIGAAVEQIIATRRPDVVCVELDPVRLQGLEERRRLHQMEAAGDPRAADIVRQQKEAIKRLPLVYRLLAKTQEKIAQGEGVEAGGEMLAAVDAARRHGLPVACIDVDAQQLIKRAWSEMRLRERFRFVWVLWRGTGDKSVNEEMEDYQEDPVAYLAKVGEQFPTLKRVLIDERDAHMATSLLSLERRRESFRGPPDTLRAVAVVGDGHVEGMLGHLQGAASPLGSGDLEVIRVQDLRDGTVPAPTFAHRPSLEAPEDGGSSVQVSWTVEVPDDPVDDEREETAEDVGR